MQKDDVRALADEVLRPILRAVGFAYTDVVERENSDGEDALYVTVHMTTEAQLQPGLMYTDALVAMQDALTHRGERRFAHLRYDFPADPPPAAGEVDG